METLPVFGKRFWLGASYFDGNSYPFNALNGDVNPSTLVYKRRLGLATSFKVWKFDLAGEWVRGRDTELLKYLSSPIPSEDRNTTVEGFYFHVELPLNESLDIRLKYDVWNPDRNLFSTFSLDREPEEPTWSTLGSALTWHFSEGALTRIVYQVNNAEKSTRSAAIVPQLLVEF